MEEEHAQDQPIDRMVERPDLDALRESYRGPSRSMLRLERMWRAARNATLWTVILALGIISALVIGYIQLF